VTTFARPSFVVALLVIAGWAGWAGRSELRGQAPVVPQKQSIAHRGASGSAPEHSAAAYRLAIEQGVQFVEQDLGVTKDNQLICIHDDTLERTTTGPGDALE